MKKASSSENAFPDQELAQRWREVKLGRASEAERSELAWRIGEAKAQAFIPQLLELLRDDDPEVRYYALQALVLDLQQKNPRTEKVCWRLLDADPDEHVKSMAAACLGSIHFGSGDRRAFERLVKVMKDPQESDDIHRSAYRALFSVAGRPPTEWPGFGVSWRDLDQGQIDWTQVAELEDSLDAVRSGK